MQESRKHEIRKKADTFRANCKTGKYGIIDLFKDCERNGYKLIRYPLGENADLGLTMKRDNDIIIFTNSCSRLSREIFTLAHEIGHAVLHIGDTARFIDDATTINEGGTDEKDQEANYFAACLLMPSDKVHKFIDLEIQHFTPKDLSAMDITRIMSEFNVSFAMALNRLENLNIIDAKQKLRLDDKKTEIRVGNLLRAVGGNSKLNLSNKEISIPSEYIEYAIYNYNHNAVPIETVTRVLTYYELDLADVSDKMVTFADNEENLDELIGGLEN